MKRKNNLGVNEGDTLRLIRSTRGDAYVGFEGIVKIDSGGSFSLFSGKSWLVNLNLKECEFDLIKRNDSGLFKINGVDYYSESSVMHKPKKCCKCGFIPVEYMSNNWIFFERVHCRNCYK